MFGVKDDNKGIKAVVLIAIVIQLCWLVAIFACNKGYLLDYKLQKNPDALHYYILGRNIIDHHTFSRCAEFPLLLSPIRTPGYPALVAFAILISRSYAVMLVMIFQALLYVVGVALLYEIVRMIANKRIALIAAILLAMDLTSHGIVYQLMTETLYTTALLFAIWLVLKYQVFNTVANAIAIGLVLALVLYIRPSGIYLALVLIPAYLLFSNTKSKNILLTMLSVVIMVITIAPWVYRNHTLFNLNKMSMVDSIDFTYHTANSIYEQQYGLSRDDAMKRISKDFGLPEYTKFMNYGILYDDYRKYDKVLMATGTKIILEHPRLFIIGTIKSPVKAMLSHSTEDLAYILNKRYTHIGLGRLLKFNFKAIRDAFMKNGAFIDLLFIYQVVFNVLVL